MLTISMIIACLPASANTVETRMYARANRSRAANGILLLHFCAIATWTPFYKGLLSFITDEDDVTCVTI